MTKSVKSKPRISFGIIVLNGEPFTRYCLRQLYPHAHEILVAEGAAVSAKAFASPDGHSLDGTLQVLHDFKANEDPEDKLRIITNPDGYWASRDEQSAAYADRATGDILWQVDIDEFYLPDHIEAVTNLFLDAKVTGAAVRWHNFWGGNKYMVDGWFLRSGGGDVNRIFRWAPGYRYGNHWTGPSAILPDGRIINHKASGWKNASDLYKETGLLCYHYGLVFPHQVLAKSTIYYNGTDPTFKHETSDDWSVNSWLNLQTPFFVHNRYDLPSWLEKSNNIQPEHAIAMFADISSGHLECKLRDSKDVRHLTKSIRYKCIRCLLKGLYALRRRLGDTHWRYYLDRFVVGSLTDGFFKTLRRAGNFSIRKLIKG